MEHFDLRLRFTYEASPRLPDARKLNPGLRSGQAFNKRNGDPADRGIGSGPGSCVPWRCAVLWPAGLDDQHLVECFVHVVVGPVFRMASPFERPVFRPLSRPLDPLSEAFEVCSLPVDMHACGSTVLASRFLAPAQPKISCNRPLNAPASPEVTAGISHQNTSANMAQPPPCRGRHTCEGNSAPVSRPFSSFPRR